MLNENITKWLFIVTPWRVIALHAECETDPFIHILRLFLFGCRMLNGYAVDSVQLVLRVK